jgi:predicted ATPase
MHGDEHPVPTPTNLTRDATSLVGRAADIEAVETRLNEGRVVTVLGTPGVGKTRLARVVARGLLPRFSGGVWCCDLSGARTAHDVLVAMARVLAIALAAGDDESTKLAGALAARGELLVLLDNVDQVAGAAAELVRAWLEQAPEAMFLVTSREPLRLDAELRYELGPLEAADAVQLFVERARASSSRVGTFEDDRTAVAQLVERLDRLPLAIELAAGRSDVLSVAQISERLDSRLELLRTDARERPAHHGTLRAALDWSWNLLGAEERTALAQCSVFRGGFAVDAAEGVLALGNGATPVLDVVEALRRRSLLTASELGGSVRLGMYELIRTFAADQLERTGQQQPAVERHARHYVEQGESWAARVEGPDATAAKRWLSMERDNLLAAIERAAATHPQLSARASIALAPVMALQLAADQRIAILEAAVAAADRDGGDALRGRALLARAEARIDVARFDEGVQDAQASLRLATAGGDDELEALALHALAVVDRIQERPEQGLRNLQAALAIHQRRGDRVRESTVLYKIGVLLHDRGELDGARRTLEEALAIAEKVADEHRQGMSCSGLGMIAYALGRWSEALALYERAAQLHDRSGAPRWRAVAVANAAMSRDELGRYDEAVAGYEDARRTFRELGARSLEANVLGALALAHLEHERFVEAGFLHRSALGIFRDMGNRLHEAIILMQMGYAECLLDRFAEAKLRLDEALQLASEGHPLRPLGLGFRAVARAALGDASAGDDLAQAQKAPACATSPWKRAALDVLRGAVEAGLARSARRSGAAEAAHRAKAMAARATARSLPPETRPVVVRIALLLLSRLLGDQPEPVATISVPALRVAKDGRWFERVGQPRVELGRRGPPRRILKALAEQRGTAPGAGLDADAVLAAGWPDERMMSSAGAMRVRTAIRTLRDLGLRDLLLTHDDGYVLDPTVSFASCES